MMATRRALPALLLLVTLGLGAVACSGDEDAQFNEVGQSIPASEGDGVAGGESGGVSDVGATVPEGAEVPVCSREVIYTADLVVRVDDVEAAAERARVLVTDAGGYVGQQSADLEEGRHVTITLRVPAAAFDGGITGLGEVLQTRARRPGRHRPGGGPGGPHRQHRGGTRTFRELLAEADGVPRTSWPSRPSSPTVRPRSSR